MGKSVTRGDGAKSGALTAHPYTLIRSPRARRLTLHIDPERGLEAVVPARLGEARARREVEAFIAERSHWVERSLAELAQRREALGTDGRITLGGLIPYAGRAHRIRAAEVSAIGVADGEILIPQKVAASEELLQTRLTTWLRRRARSVAEQMIAVYAPEMKVQPTRLRIADQSSRWGSASADGTISLSWRLVMAPPEVADYVVIHEVVHLEELNHSKRFWQKVKALAPDFLKAKQWLERHRRLLQDSV